MLHRFQADSRAVGGDAEHVEGQPRHRIDEAIIGAAQTYQTTSTGKAEDEELELLFYQHSSKIEEEMMAQPSTCAADFAAKAIVDSCKGGLMSDWETGAFWKEARQLIKSAA